LDVAPQSSLAALGLLNGDVEIWDYGVGIEMRRLRGHTQAVRAIAFPSDGQRLISGADDQTLRLWYVATGESLAGRRTPQININPQERRVAQANSELAAA